MFIIVAKPKTQVIRNPIDAQSDLELVTTPSSSPDQGEEPSEEQMDALINAELKPAPRGTTADGLVSQNEAVGDKAIALGKIREPKDPDKVEGEIDG